jgi:hypothetical protein
MPFKANLKASRTLSNEANVDESDSEPATSKLNSFSFSVRFSIESTLSFFLVLVSYEFPEII